MCDNTLYVKGQKACVHCTVCVNFMFVPSRYESVLVLQQPVEEDSGTYKIVASAGSQSKEFSFKLYVKGKVFSISCTTCCRYFICEQPD